MLHNFQSTNIVIILVLPYVRFFRQVVNLSLEPNVKSYVRELFIDVFANAFYDALGVRRANQSIRCQVVQKFLTLPLWHHYKRCS